MVKLCQVVKAYCCILDMQNSSACVFRFVSQHEHLELFHGTTFVELRDTILHHFLIKAGIWSLADCWTWNHPSGTKWQELRVIHQSLMSVFEVLTVAPQLTDSYEFDRI